jgi:hypothetical protein
MSNIDKQRRIDAVALLEQRVSLLATTQVQVPDFSLNMGASISNFPIFLIIDNWIIQFILRQQEK